MPGGPNTFGPPVRAPGGGAPPNAGGRTCPPCIAPIAMGFGAGLFVSPCASGALGASHADESSSLTERIGGRLDRRIMVYPFLNFGLAVPGILGVSSAGTLGAGVRSALAIAVRLSLRPKGPTGKDLFTSSDEAASTASACRHPRLQGLPAP